VEFANRNLPGDDTTEGPELDETGMTSKARKRSTGRRRVKEPSRHDEQPMDSDFNKTSRSSGSSTKRKTG